MTRYIAALFVASAMCQTNSRITLPSKARVNSGQASISGSGYNLWTQSTITYTAPNSSPCQVKVSTSPSLTPLINDVNPALFPNSDYDSRDTALSNGTTRLFVVGKRTTEKASDSNYYSRALQNDTRYYYQACGTISGSFTTMTIPAGVTRNDMQQPVPGTGGWPTVTLTGVRGQQVIDPLSGTLYVRQTLPSDVLGTPVHGFIQGFGGLTRPHTKTLFTSGDGKQGYVSNYWDDNGGGNMYFFIPSTGEVRAIGNASGIIFPVMRDDKTFLKFRSDLTPVGLYSEPYTGTFMSGDFALGTPVLNQASSSGGPCTALNVLDPTRFPTPFADYECNLIPTYANEYTSFFFQNTGLPHQDSPGVEGVMWGGDGRPYDSTCAAGPTLCPHAVAAYIVGSPSNLNACTVHNNEMWSTNLVQLNLKANDGSCPGGFASIAFWTFLTDPTGASITSGPWGHGGHDDFNGPSPLSPNGTGGANPNGPTVRVEEASSFCPGGPNSCAYDVAIGNPQSSTITTTPTTAIGAYNPFAGVAGASSFGLVRHPNWEGDALQSSTNNASTFFDMVVYGGGGYPGGDIIAASVTLVSGKTNTYKFVGTGPLHIKQQDTVARSAGSMLRDISSPSLNTLCDTSTCNLQYCVVVAAGECITGSSPGDIYFTLTSISQLGCYGSETPNIAQADICIMDSSLHMAQLGQFWGLGGVDATDKSRMIGHMQMPAVSFSYGNPTAKPYPDTSWATFSVGLFNAFSTSDIWAAKIPSWAVPDGKDRTTFLHAPVSITTPSSLGIATAAIEFGYSDYGAASFHQCTSRAETCVAGAATVTESLPFQFKQTETPVRLACTSSCTITLPVLPGHTAYYTVKFYDALGDYVTDGDSGVAVEDTVVSVGNIAPIPIGFGTGTLSIGLTNLFDWNPATPSGCSAGANQFCVGTSPTGDTIYCTGWAANASLLPVTTGLPIVCTQNDFHYGAPSGNLMLMQLAAFDWATPRASKIALINLMTSYGTSGASIDSPAGWKGHCTSSDDGSQGCTWKSRDPFVRNGLLYLPVERQISSGVPSVHDATMIVSADGGATWKNPYTIATAGSASATGDAMPCNAAAAGVGNPCTATSYPGSIMWQGLSTSASNWKPIHYMQDGAVPPPGINDGCNPAIWSCFILGESEGSVARVKLTDLPSLDVTKFQYWTCPGLTDSPSSVCDGSNPNAWTSTFASRTPALFVTRGGTRSINLAEIFGVAWIKEFHAYLMAGSMYRDGGVNPAYLWAPSLQGPWSISLAAPPVAYGVASSTLLFPGFITPNLGLGYTTLSTSPPHVRVTAVMDTAAYTAETSPLFGQLDLVAGVPSLLNKGVSPRTTNADQFTTNAGYALSSSGSAGTVPSVGLSQFFDMADQGGDSTVSGLTGFHDVASGSAFMVPYTGTLFGFNPGQGSTLLNFGAQLVNGGYGMRYTTVQKNTNYTTANAPSFVRGNGTFTVAGVFRYDSATFIQGPLWVMGDASGSNTEVALSMTNSCGCNLEVGWGVNANRWRYLSTFTMTPGIWYFMAVTVTAGSPNPTSHMYVGVAGSIVDEINGVSRTSTGGTPTQIPNVVASPLVLGLEPGQTNSVNASYAGIAVHSGASSLSDVTLMYNTMKSNLAGRGVTVQ